MNETIKMVVLEPSTHTHTISAQKITTTDLGDGILAMVIEGDGIVKHGEHGTFKTESENVMKYRQLELNPVSDKLRHAFD